MRWAVLILVLLFASPGRAQPEPASVRGFNSELAASVFSAALAFTAPRTIEAVTIPQLTVWGLNGVTVADTALTVELRDGGIALDVGGKALFQRGAPAVPTPEAWAAAAADVFAAAWAASPAVRQADTQGLISAFFDEIFNHLDPYSRYVPPESANVDRARRLGEAGAGLQIARRGGALVVQDVNADGPAGESGVVAGDRLVAVDGQPTRNASLDTVMGWLDGMEGTGVSLTVRGRDGRLRTVEVERAVTPPETVFAQRAGPVLTLRITAFSADTAQRVGRELETAFHALPVARRPRGLVLDLRGNRGGLLRPAIAAAGLLLDAGVIAVTQGRNPVASHQWAAASGDVTEGVPVIVVVDGRSASAAEILTAALADQGRAIVVGSSTLGKGLVQTIATLPDGGELFVTWSRVLAPWGWPIQGLGVLPQVCTSLGQDGMAQQLASLERGTQPLQPALDRHRLARVPLTTAAVLGLRSACPAGEGRDFDLVAARYLLAHPLAYAAARIMPPPAGALPAQTLAQ